MTPDERQYTALAIAARARGLRSTADMAEPGLPGPSRWLWVWWVSLFPPGSIWPSRVFAILQPWSCVALWSGNRRLQDGAVSFFTLAAIAAGHWGHPCLAALAIAILLSVKEAAILAVPAIWAAGAPWWAVLLGLAGWTVGGLLVFRDKWFNLLMGAVGGHDTEYGKRYQSSGLVLIGALLAANSTQGNWFYPSAILLMLPAFSPVKNFRLLGALEGLVILAHPWLIVVVWLWLRPSLNKPGSGGWKDERGTVDLVPDAIVDAFRE